MNEDVKRISVVALMKQGGSAVHALAYTLQLGLSLIAYFGEPR